MSYKDICLDKYGYYEMANSDIADGILEEVKKNYSEAIIIKAGIHQYIVVNEKGKKILNTKLENERQSYEESLSKLDYVIYELGLKYFEE